MLPIMTPFDELMGKLSKCKNLSDAVVVIQDVGSDAADDLKKVVKYVLNIQSLDENLESLPLEVRSERIKQLLADADGNDKLQSILKQAAISCNNSENEAGDLLLNTFRSFNPKELEDITVVVKSLQSQLRNVFEDSSLSKYKYTSYEGKFVSCYVWCIMAMLKLNKFLGCLRKEDILELMYKLHVSGLQQDAVMIYTRAMAELGFPVRVDMHNGYKALISFTKEGDISGVEIVKG